MDKSALIGKRAARTKDVPVEGGTVTVRALTREEAFAVRDKSIPIDEAERRILALAMVEPALTAKEVGEWQKVSPAGEIQDVFAVVLKLSGMEAQSGKDAYKSV